MHRRGGRRAAVVAALLTASSVVAGCGGDSPSENANEKLAEQAVEDAGGGDVDIDIDDDEVTIEGEDGTVKIGTGDVPEGFPDGLTIAEGEIISSVDTAEGAMVSVTVDDALAAFDDVVADLEASGWTKDQVTESGEIRTAMYSKGDDHVMVIADAASGTISYTVGAG